MKKIYIFDVDGTLTPSRMPIDKDFGVWFDSFAKSFVPSPPFAQWVQRLALTPNPSQKSIKAFTSLSVSLIKWLTATATGKPNFFTFSIFSLETAPESNWTVRTGHPVFVFFRFKSITLTSVSYTHLTLPTKRIV